MTTQLAPLSACVTRILSVSGFPKELRTKDINSAFSDWDNVSGGFKIKWKDDTSLYVVFNDASVAKRAYLQVLCSPPAIFNSPPPSPKSSGGGADSPSDTTSAPAVNGASSSKAPAGTKVRPYNGPDAQQIIQSTLTRGNSHGHARGHSSHKSISVGGGAGGAHARMGSFSTNGGFRGGPNGTINGGGNKGQGLQKDVIQEITIPTSVSAPQGMTLRDREPSPTLPNLPQQPTLNSLISSSLSPDISQHAAGDPLATANNDITAGKGAPRVGDPGRRMVAHSLGVKLPGMNKAVSGEELSNRMREMAIAE